MVYKILIKEEFGVMLSCIIGMIIIAHVPHYLLPYPPAMYRRPVSTARPALDLGVWREGPDDQLLDSAS